MNAHFAEVGQLPEDVAGLVARHLAFTAPTCPTEFGHALDHAALVEPGVTLFSLRADTTLVAVGALRELSEEHGELKSMHTAVEARGRGYGRQMLGGLLTVARDRGYQRVSLETGTTPEFAAARALYAGVGFTPCPAFGGYPASEWNAFMTLELAR